MLLLTTLATLLVSLLAGFCLSFVLAIREAFELQVSLTTL